MHVKYYMFVAPNAKFGGQKYVLVSNESLNRRCVPHISPLFSILHKSVQDNASLSSTPPQITYSSLSSNASFFLHRSPNRYVIHSIGKTTRAMKASNKKVQPTSNCLYILLEKIGIKPPRIYRNNMLTAVPDAECTGYASTVYVPVKNCSLSDSS